MKRIEIDPSRCCGCSVCASVCSKNAIKLEENDKGFLVPYIDDSKCVDCGLCSKVCPFSKEKEIENNTLRAYSLELEDRTSLKLSTSGGAFTALSDAVLRNGGIVVGSVMEPDFSVHHIIAEDSMTRDKMRGSKYVQSDTSGVWGKIMPAIKDGRQVLFTGTPCQCAAIRSLTNDKYPNLIVVDFLCHGVPSNKMFKDHIEFLDDYYGKKVTEYTFRDKKYGWNSYNNNIYTENGRFHSKWINQVYYNFFVSNLSLRDCCFNCPFRSMHRPSDITIADFWGIEKLTKKKNHDGVSLVLTHSDKGQNLFDEAAKECRTVEYPYEKIAFRIAMKSAKPNKLSDVFWMTYKERGYKGVADKYFNNSLKNRLRYEVRKLAKLLKLN